MLKKTGWVAGAAAIFVAGFSLGSVSERMTIAHAQSTKVYELRTYTAPEGKLGDLHARFRNHTMRIFDKHGMKSVAYFSPQDAPLSQNTLIYILEHPSRDEAKKHWAEFQADPEWQKVSAESQKDGRIVSKVDSVFMTATDYSPMK
jgi:NIPSNAP protein